MNSSYFYRDEPLFGLDIGHSAIKVMQSHKSPSKNEYSVVGYGVGEFDSSSIKDGVITDHKKLAEAIVKLFDKNIVGEINSHRVAMSIPAAKTFTRTMTLPNLKNDDITEAVRTEAEQYIPMPIEDLYLDHSIVTKSENEIEVLAVAVPKKIVDSHIELAKIIGLEPVGFDTSILAAARLFQRQDKNNDVPAVLIDFGSTSTDITVYDKAVIVTSTVPHGGDTMTSAISTTLGISIDEAHIIKSKYGIAKSRKQDEIVTALRPEIDRLAKEIQRMIRYHEERSGSHNKIGQIVSMGGGANMPGLADYLTDALRLPVRTCEPLQNFNLHKLRAPSALEKSIYVTVAGLSLIQPEELFTS